MEVEFNTERVSQTSLTPPVSRTVAAASASDTASFPTTDSLLAKLKDIPMIRESKIAQAQALLSNGEYPPEDILDRIAVLIAANVHN